MATLIILFGALTLFVGVVIVIDPDRLFGLFRKHVDTLELHILAVVVRLVLGALLIYLADASRFPLVIEIIGWISIVAALFFAVIGRARFRRIMAWALSLARPVVRVGGVFAVGFGAFLVYAFI